MMPPKTPKPAVAPDGMMAYMDHATETRLVKAQKAGIVRPDAVRRMQHHCSACADPRACAAVLCKHASDLDEPPKFCVNRKLMMAIRQQLRDYEAELKAQAEAEEAAAHARSRLYR